MKKLLRLVLSGSLFACVAAVAQTSPYLEITIDSPQTVQMSWSNQVGITYRILSTPSLSETISWFPFADAFSPAEKVAASIGIADTPIAFYRVFIPTNTGVEIFYPTNDQTVSDEIGIGIGAQLGTELQGVKLYLDDAVVGYTDSGATLFSLDTTHFSNGEHTIYVAAVDTSNNETFSSSITVTFDNPVRWLDASSMFNTFVPITVESDIFPADWMVSVIDSNGTMVCTFTGTTSDGNIQTSWDGTDNNSNPLPVENFYEIIVDVVGTGEIESFMMTESKEIPFDASSFPKVNMHGVPEFTFETALPNPLTEYFRVYDGLTPEEKLIYPPLPPLSEQDFQPVVISKLSAREMFLVKHKTPQQSSSFSSFSIASSSGSSGSGSTKNLVWWENPWSSAQTLLARVPIPGAFGTVVQNYFLQIRDLIEAATSEVGNHRGVYGPNSIYVIQNSSDLSTLTNSLANSGVRAFYFYGHGNTNGNSFGTLSAGIFAKDLAKLLGNFYWPSLPPSYGRFAGKPAMQTTHPFAFVFLDGCNTGNGSLPEAFGIPKKATGALLSETGLHKRAFMGWSGPVTFQFDNVHFAWTQKFWATWLDEGESYQRTVVQAILAANQFRPQVPDSVPIDVWGSISLKWID